MKSPTPKFAAATLSRALAAALTVMAGTASAGFVDVLPEATSDNTVVLKKSGYTINGVETPVNN